jgi:ATP-dependent helicase/nuclease subunit B
MGIITQKRVVKVEGIFKNSPCVFNIPLGLSFVDCLAKNVLKHAPKSTFSLIDTTILLPNRRSVRALKEAFLRLSDGTPMVLPSIKAIGDVEGEDIALMGGSDFNALDIPEAINPKHRQLILTRLISKAGPRLGFQNLSMPQALGLAKDLAYLIDEVETQEAKWEDLIDIVEKDLAHHWQQTLKFLEIVTEAWPKVLEDLELIDPSKRRRLLLNNYRKKLERLPPPGPVIAAGSTGTIPATARLLKTISRLPKGAIVLPGLDLNLPKDIWESLSGDKEELHSSETHPQFALKTLLDNILVSRDEVEPWPQDETDKKILSSLSLRQKIISTALLPPKAMPNWQDLKIKIANQGPLKNALENISLHEADGIREEAGAIALMMREALETPHKRVALITANTQLARRVESELKKWDITIDKSSGSPLDQSPPATFMSLIAEVVAANFAPLPLLAFLKHPLTSAGFTRMELLELTRGLEVSILRGPRPERGFTGLLKSLAGKNKPKLITFLKNLKDIFKPLTTQMGLKENDFKVLLECHIRLSEKLVGTKGMSGEELLWAKDEGISLSKLLRDIFEFSQTLGRVDPLDYPLLFKRMLEGDLLRHSYGGHPRLQIWGTLEGRLQSTDMVILGDLNEGSWPPSPPEDPWMSRPMRQDFGLSSPERRIGQSAHDFTQALGTSEVILTRALKIDGTPTVPSRWLLRLEALLGVLPQGKPWGVWQKNITSIETPMPIPPPEPRPPVGARPLGLSVTNIEKWMRDPYALFAKYILKITPLKPLDQEPGAAEKGTLIHKALEGFTKSADQSFEGLLGVGRKVFEDNITRPGVWAFWWPRFEQVAEAFIKIEKSRNLTHKILATEVRGEVKIGAFNFKLSATADRIDGVLKDSSFEIIDYKTGTPPSIKQIESGFAPQLPLEGVIAKKGGFTSLGIKEVTSFKYWKVQGGKKPIEIPKNIKLDIALEIEKAEEGLIKLIDAFMKFETPYLSNPDPSQKSYGEYNHLARVKEWINESPAHKPSRGRTVPRGDGDD